MRGYCACSFFAGGYRSDRLGAAVRLEEENTLDPVCIFDGEDAVWPKHRVSARLLMSRFHRVGVVQNGKGPTTLRLAGPLNRALGDQSPERRAARSDARLALPLSFWKRSHR